MSVEEATENIKTDGDKPDDGPKLVVGIGASAGGLEPLEQLFERMPDDTGMAFVVIQHLSPDFESMMEELLVRKTKLPVHTATDQLALKRDSIYLIPRGKEMIVSGGRLLLKDKDPDSGVPLPINQFFKSLANDAGDRCVGIILSGTGNDGARGVCDIHEAGGLVIVQDDKSAKFMGMPSSAMETGIVDLILPPADIGEILARYVAGPDRRKLIAEFSPVGSDETVLKKLIGLLRDTHDVDFSAYKPTTVLRRIERRLLLSDSASFEEYVERATDDAGELDLLYHDLLIGVTRFFRDPDAFKRLETELLPEMLKRHPKGEEFRVWVAGCATGEEVYSLAMLLHEAMTPEQFQRVKIFATDVHRASLDLASDGVYEASSLANVSPERKRHYFTQDGDKFRINGDLRQSVVFAEQNVVKDAPFTRLNLISCRNMLIYLKPGIQRKVISLFHFGLRLHGVLFLGPSETVGDLEDDFKAIDRHWRIYSKRRDVRHDNSLKLPVSDPREPTLGAVANASSEALSVRTLRKVYDELLDQFLPPSILVNRKREVVHVFGNAGDYLHFQRGRTTGDLLDLFEGELKTVVSGAIQRVMLDAKATTYSGIELKSGGQPCRIQVSVTPIFCGEDQMTHALVVFDELKIEANNPDLEPVDDESDAASHSQARIQLLESDLLRSRNNLQATIEELEASNEELQATNEELIASNEEMQSTNQELHSVNEELYTVNAEYQRKISELTVVTEDMNHLLESTDVGVLFLDRDLSIRKFTPKIAQSFNFIERDVGRSFEDFTHTIKHDSLADDIRWVLSTGQLFEKDVQDRKNHDYFLRILPYRVASEIDGVVITLIDVSSLKRAQKEIRERDIRLRGIFENSPSFIFIKDLQGRYLVASQQSRRVFELKPTEIVGRTNQEFLPQHVADRLDENDRRVIQTGETLESEETIPRNGKGRTYLSVKFPLLDENKQIVAVAGIKTDITKRKLAQRKAQRAIRERDRFLATLSHELRNPLAAIKNAGKVLSRINSDDPRVLSVSDVINRQSDQLSCILDDLLDISRVVQGKIDLRQSVVDIRDTASDALLSVRSMATAAGVKIRKDITLHSLPVYGDRSRLQQVFVNLLVNAVKYTPTGGQIDLTIQRVESSAKIAVSDNGAGMSPQLVNRIFDPFVQGEDTLHRSQGGMGVGLTLVKSLVELHGGTISAASPGLDQGSTFSVALPLTDQKLIEGEVHGEVDLEIPPLKIVIVEDNVDSRAMLKLALEMDGHNVVAVEDGLSGLTAIDAEKPQIAFVDIGLPEMDGYEVARRLCAKQLNERTMLVALTGFGQLQDVEKAIDAGFHHHITKPVDAHELETILARAAGSVKK